MEKSTVTLDDKVISISNWGHDKFEDIKMYATQITNAKELHTILNFLDMYKDGRVAPNITTHPNFILETKTLFPDYMGKVPNPMNILSEIEKKILDNSTFSNNVKIVPLVNLNGNIDNTKKLPDNYKYAFVDAAAKSSEFNKDIINIETPGSFIDPATRSCIDGACCVLPRQIEINLDSFGFKGVMFKATLESSNAVFGIEITQKSDRGEVRLINVEVDRNGKDRNGKKISFFAGNKEKNESINTGSSDTEKLLLGKELGDTMQVIIAYILNLPDTDVKSNDVKSNSLMFTPDGVVTTRCVGLGVPCALSAMIGGKDNPEHHQFIFYTPVRDAEVIKKNWNKHLLNQTIKHNEDIIANIDMFLIPQYINEYISSKHNNSPAVKTKLVDLLIAVKMQLNFIINEILIKQSSDEEMLKLKNNVINLYTKSFQANAVILTPRGINGKILSYKLNSTLKRLLPTPINKIDKYDMRQIMSGLDTIYSTVNIGGGPKKQIREYLQMTSWQGQQGGAFNFDDLDLVELKYGFYSYLYNYFDYVGAAVYDIGFLTYLFKLFYNDKRELPTLIEFEDIYSIYYNNTLKQYLDQYNELDNETQEVSLLKQSNIFLDKLDALIKTQQQYKQKNEPYSGVDTQLYSGPADSNVNKMDGDGDVIMDIGKTQKHEYGKGKTPPPKRSDSQETLPPPKRSRVGPAGPALGGNKRTKRFRKRNKYKKSKKINKKQNKKNTRKVKKNTRKFKKNTLRKEN